MRTQLVFVFIKLAQHGTMANIAVGEGSVEKAGLFWDSEYARFHKCRTPWTPSWLWAPSMGP